jgi:hypothetical protein
MKFESEILEVAKRYETKLTTDLNEIAGIQQSKFLVPSSVLFNNLRGIVGHGDLSNNQEQFDDRPVSAQVIYDKAKYLKAVSTKTLEPVNDKQDTISEADVLDNVSRSKVDVRTIKKNTYQIKSKATVSGISGFRAKKLIDLDKKEDLEAELRKKQDCKFSPFLLYPMDEEEPIGDIFDTGNKRSNNLLPLEYFIFPEHLDSDNVYEKYLRIKEGAMDGRVYGFTKFYDSHGNFTWSRCELLDYDPSEEKFLIKWIDKFVTKKVMRSNFYFEGEDSKEYFKMLNNASRWRELSCTYMRYLDIIDKMDSQTNHLRDEIKDKVTLLVLNNQFKIRPPRDPIEKEKIPAKQRFDCNQILIHRLELVLPQNYNVVDHFSSKKYDLKYFNLLNEEISTEFVKANHQIELENSLPYNHQLQKMFRGLLDDNLFIPFHIKHQIPAPKFGVLVPLNQDKTELNNYLELFNTMKSKLHQANHERIAILSKVNIFLEGIRSLCFVMSQFEKGFDIPTFLANQKYASDNFFREISDKSTEINEKIFNIVTRELEDMKKRNEYREKTIQIASLKASLMEKELPAQVVRTLTRFMKMLNSKFEYYIKEALRSSLLAYNKSFQNILDRFERMMNAKPGSIDFSNLNYNTVLDYQNHMQYQKHSEDCPLVAIKLSVVDKSIVLEKEMDTFKQDLKEVGSN